jgi:hypothetical protein
MVWTFEVSGKPQNGQQQALLAGDFAHYRVEPERVFN